MQKTLYTTVVLLGSTLLFTGCIPMLGMMGMNNGSMKCGGMMNMSKNKNMKCSGDASQKTSKNKMMKCTSGKCNKDN